MRSDSPCPDNGAIKSHVRGYYADLYGNKQACRVPIQKGKRLAEALGYPLDLLDFIPQSHWERFFPCGNPLQRVHPSAGERILNLGCGAAIDSLALWVLYGKAVQVVSMDVVLGVLQKASKLAGSSLLAMESSGQGLSWICADGEQLPFQAGAFHWVILNGVFNLFPDKASLLHEISRILSPAGQLVATDLCIEAPLPDYFHQERDAWAWCMSGACTEEQLGGLLSEEGFEEIQVSHEEEADMFHRISFCCRKAGRAGT